MDGMRMRGGVWLLLGALAFSIGCGQSGPATPKTYPVTGTVTYKGEPVADANLNFMLATGSGNSFAKTDQSGKYELMTFKQGDGALPGDYKVAITKYEAPPSTGSSNMDENYVPPPENAPSVPSKNLLPKKYADSASSGLTAKVVEGPNTFDFQLTD